MKLVPKVNNTELAGAITIHADQPSLERANAAVASAAKLTTVTTETLNVVVEQSKVLHGFISEIEKSRQAAKRNFLDANTAIDNLAKKISLPIRKEYDRLTYLLADWKDAEDRRKAEEERLKHEAELKVIEEAKRKAQEEELERQELLKKAHEAKTQAQLEQAALDLDFHDAEIPVVVTFSEEIPVIEPPKAPISGAVTTKRYRFKLLDPVAAYQYSNQLVSFELRASVANDIVRSLNEKKLELRIPGVLIESYTDVATPSSR